MTRLDLALQGAARPSPPTPPARGALPLVPLLIVGAGGRVGSALLAEALVAGRYARVQALVALPLESSMRGLQPLPLAALNAAAAGAAPPVASTAVVVFERERHSNRRDDAFVAPDPDRLPSLARTLRHAGVANLVVVVPHAPALLPHALKYGLANEVEREVAAIGCERLVFVRAAQTAAGIAPAGAVDRFAAWWLSQLRWMVPQREQPQRAATLARCVALLARRLPGSRPGTRVLPPEVLWAATAGDSATDPVLAAWLAGDAPP